MYLSDNELDYIICLSNNFHNGMLTIFALQLELHNKFNVNISTSELSIIANQETFILINYLKGI